MITPDIEGYGFESLASHTKLAGFTGSAIPVSCCWGPDLRLREDDRHLGSSGLASV